MPIQTGYTQMGTPGVFDLAAVGQRQQQIDMQKKAKQQEQLQKSIEAVSDAYKKMKQKQKTEKEIKELRDAGIYDEKIAFGPEGGTTTTFETPTDYSGMFGGGMMSGQYPGYGGYGWGQGGQDYFDLYGLE